MASLRETTQTWAKWDPLGRAARWTWRFITKRWRWIIGVVAVLTVVAGILLIVGKLDDVYDWLYEGFPGRQWTYVMRDYPWVYVLLAVALTVIVLTGFDFTGWKNKSWNLWQVLVILWVVFLVGFLGGHVFWGKKGPGYSWCDTDRLAIAVDPHHQVVAPQGGSDGLPDHAIHFIIRVDAREGQPIEVFDVDLDFSNMPGSFNEAADVTRIWIDDTDHQYHQAVIIRPAEALPAGDYKIPIEVTEEGEFGCRLKRDYEIEIP